MPVIIGIPIRNDFDSFKIMINSLINSTDAFDKVVIIESESTDGSKEFSDLFAKINSKFEVIHTLKEGPLKAYNKLFDIAKKRKCDLLLTQSDVIFPKCYNRDWLMEMKYFAQINNIGAVTTWNGGGISGTDYIDKLYWLGGWCTYYPLRTIERIGRYDESFPNGYGVDIDYSYRIKLAKLIIIQINYWVDHHMANSREHDKDINTEQMKQDSAKYFRHKYKLGEFAVKKFGGGN